MAKVITFYSYKGGVGRTMALVNTAYILARNGWRVLMVDFDLEAPGMTYFFADQLTVRPDLSRRDALDLLLDARQTLTDGSPVASSLKDYVINIDLPFTAPETEGGIPYWSGKLDLLPATFDPVEEDPKRPPSRDYLARIAELDLPEIFASQGPRHRFGDHVRRYFQNARFGVQGDPLFTIRKTVQASYDIVLIDSRTGFNEISGLCIGPVCDGLVICLGLNDQNLFGTRFFMEKSGLADRSQAKPYLVTAGPVPAWHTRMSDEQISRIRQVLNADVVVPIPYHPLAAISEVVFARQDPREQIAAAYEELASVLIQQTMDFNEKREVARKLFRRVYAGEQVDFREIAIAVVGCFGAARLAPGSESIRPRGLLASFPSSCTVCSLPYRGKPLTWQDVERIPVAAAVAAYRLQSDAPFQRAWELLSAGGEPGIVHDLAIRLAYFQFTVRGTLPDHSRFLEVFKYVFNATRRDALKSLGLDRNIASLIMWDAHVAALAFRGHNPLRMNLARSEISALDFLAQGSDVIFYNPGYWERLVSRFETNWPKSLTSERFPILVYKLNKAVLKMRDRRKLASVVRHVGPPAEVEEVLSQPWTVLPRIGEATLSVKGIILLEEKIFGPPRDPMPLFCWPEPLLASAVSLVKGKEGMREVLAWIVQARMIHGYAWRVLVDWRHLASVRDDPAFLHFLREEDARVEEIESAIDQGVYPL